MPKSTSDSALARFDTVDRKFRRARQQIQLLNNKIHDIQGRYDQAYKADSRSFRYTYRLQLSTLEGIRNAFYEYACQRADDLEELQQVLIGMGLISVSSEN